LRDRSRNGVKLAVLAAVAIGFTLVFLGKAADHDALTGVAVARMVTVPVLGLIVLHRRTPLPTPALPSLALIGVLDTAANAAFAYATTAGLLTLVAVLGGLFPVVTVGLAYSLLHERLQPLQRAGVILALAGIPLISA
jgi:drug/metabolite transporter (DMT)-like permease